MKYSLLLVAMWTLACGGGSDSEVLAEVSCEALDSCPSGQVCASGVCILAPGDEVVVTNNSVFPNESSGEAPNLECINGQLATPDGPAEATIYGIVDRFGGGRETYSIEVSVFLAKDWPPKECTSLAFDKQQECFRNVKSEWTTVSKPPFEEKPVEAACTDFNHKECPGAGYECVQTDLDFFCQPQWGIYEIAGVPTNTPLVIRSRNDVSNPSVETKWRDSYVLGVYLYADRVDKDGRYNTHALMVSQSQWTTIPQTLGLVKGIKPINGAVGGRVRDCRTDKRDSYTLGNVSVGLAIAGSKTGYFNDNEEETVPLLNRNSTDIFGRFTIVDVKPGENKLVGAFKDSQGYGVLGSESIYVVPGSLVVTSYPGKQAILNK